jgi:hypothetical protein
MNARRGIVTGTVILLLVAAVVLIIRGVGKKRPEPIEPDEADSSAARRPKGFKLVDYYSNTGGVQRIRSVLTGSEGELLTNGMIFLVHPRIETYREDGALEWVATSLDATVSREARIAVGTNLVSFRSGDTNFYVAGRGFLWQQSNSVLIVSNQSYVWISQTSLTNSPSKK